MQLVIPKQPPKPQIHSLFLPCSTITVARTPHRISGTFSFAGYRVLDIPRIFTFTDYDLFYGHSSKPARIKVSNATETASCLFHLPTVAVAQGLIHLAPAPHRLVSNPEHNMLQHNSNYWKRTPCHFFLILSTSSEELLIIGGKSLIQ